MGCETEEMKQAVVTASRDSGLATLRYASTRHAVKDLDDPRRSPGNLIAGSEV
jgi:hypothetical protein